MNFKAKKLELATEGEWVERLRRIDLAEAGRIEFEARGQ